MAGRPWAARGGVTRSRGGRRAAALGRGTSRSLNRRGPLPPTPNRTRSRGWGAGRPRLIVVGGRVGVSEGGLASDSALGVQGPPRTTHDRFTTLLRPPPTPSSSTSGPDALRRREWGCRAKPLRPWRAGTKEAGLSLAEPMPGRGSAPASVDRREPGGTEVSSSFTSRSSGARPTSSRVNDEWG